jgi:hypothetical protein
MATLISAPEMVDKLSRAMETGEKPKLGALTLPLPMPLPRVIPSTITTPLKTSAVAEQKSSKSQQQASQVVANDTSSLKTVAHVYLITDNNNDKNAVLKRNQTILDESEFKYTVLTARDLNLYNFQQQVKEALTHAKENNFETVAVINGNYMIHRKFAQILAIQLAHVNKPFKLWYLGGLSIKNKDIRNKFSREDYLMLYDDIRQAQLGSDERLLKHWRSYGMKEGRTGQIEIYPSPAKYQTTDINHGFLVTSGSYQTLIDQLGKVGTRNTRDVISDFAGKISDKSTLLYSQPDLTIPAVKVEAGTKSKKILDMTMKNGWYLNSYM